MWKPFIGQRVRIKQSNLRSPIRGEIGRVKEERKFLGGVVGYGLDISPIEYDSSEGGFLCWIAEQLEPVPDNHEPAEMDIYELCPFLKEQDKVASD